jgi:hypothetical protein
MVAALPIGPGLCLRRVRIARESIAWLRYTLEAHEGLAFMHSDGTGEVSLLTTDSQERALDALIADLRADGLVEPVDAAPPSF